MRETNREKWIEVLETVAQKRPDEAEAEWAWLMQQLGLGAEYFLAIYEAVRQGGWREAENPAGYIKAVARREAGRQGPDGERRMRGLRGIRGLESDGKEITVGPGEMDGESFTEEEMLDHLEYRQDSGKPMRDPDGVWRTAAGWEADPEGLLRPAAETPRKQLTRQEALKPGPLLRDLERLKRMWAAAGKDERDEPYMDGGMGLPDIAPELWAQWAREAGLSDWEQKAIEYKLSGVGWTEAMAVQPDEVSRRALQAAWRSVERSGERRLRRTTKTKNPGNTEETEE